MKQIFVLETGKGCTMVAADSTEQAKAMVAEPALVEMGMLKAEAQAELAAAAIVNVGMEDVFILKAMGFTVLTEALVMAAKTSVRLFKDESIKLFSTADKRYVIAAKSKDDAINLVAEIAAIPHRDGSECDHGELCA